MNQRHRPVPLPPPLFFGSRFGRLLAAGSAALLLLESPAWAGPERSLPPLRQFEEVEVTSWPLWHRSISFLALDPETGRFVSDLTHPEGLEIAEKTPSGDWITVKGSDEGVAIARNKGPRVLTVVVDISVSMWPHRELPPAFVRELYYRLDPGDILRLVTFHSQHAQSPFLAKKELHDALILRFQGTRAYRELREDESVTFDAILQGFLRQSFCPVGMTLHYEACQEAYEGYLDRQGVSGRNGVVLLSDFEFQDADRRVDARAFLEGLLVQSFFVLPASLTAAPLDRRDNHVARYWLTKESLPEIVADILRRLDCVFTAEFETPIRELHGGCSSLRLSYSAPDAGGAPRSYKVIAPDCWPVPKDPFLALIRQIRGSRRVLALLDRVAPEVAADREVRAALLDRLVREDDVELAGRLLEILGDWKDDPAVRAGIENRLRRVRDPGLAARLRAFLEPAAAAP